MGVIKSGIQGGFSGKVGSHVGSFWKGIAVMRKMPDSVANPNTIGQQVQRSKFKAISSLASSLLVGIVKPLWDRQAVRMSGYNLFVKTNIKAVKDGGIFDFPNLLMSKGRIPTVPITASISELGTSVAFTWDGQELPAYASEDDSLYIVILDDNGNLLAQYNSEEMRGYDSTTVFSDKIEGVNKVHCYVTFQSPDKKYQSDSVYIKAAK